MFFELDNEGKLIGAIPRTLRQAYDPHSTHLGIGIAVVFTQVTVEGRDETGYVKLTVGVANASDQLLPRSQSPADIPAETRNVEAHLCQNAGEQDERNAVIPYPVEDEIERAESQGDGGDDQDSLGRSPAREVASHAVEELKVET
jgi:hypothetical protein